MKVTVDYDLCASTGACMQICPEVFEVRSDGYLYILQDEPRRGAANEGRGGRRAVPDGGDHRQLTDGIVRTVGFYDQLKCGWAASGSMMCVGLDPDPDRMPTVLETQRRPGLGVLPSHRRCHRRPRLRVQAADRVLRRRSAPRPSSNGSAPTSARSIPTWR